MGSLAAKKVIFPKDNKLKAWWRKFEFEKLWEGRQLGLLRNDEEFYVMPEVKEAVRRLPPHEYDARQMRLVRASILSMRNEILPKDQWTKWEEEIRAILDEGVKGQTSEA